MEDSNLFGGHTKPSNISQARKENSESSDVIGGPQIQRCVIVQKDEQGYGLTVSGDNPVFVQSVKEGGAAAKAGVQTGDRIIKVNGTLVTNSNHLEVVRLVKAAGNHVALTLQGNPLGARPLGPPPHPHYKHGKQRPASHYDKGVPIRQSSTCSDKVTSPLPADPEKQREALDSTISTIKLMLDNEKMYFEKLRQDYAKNPSEKTADEMNNCKKRIKAMETQYMSKADLDTHHHKRTSSDDHAVPTIITRAARQFGSTSALNTIHKRGGGDRSRMRPQSSIENISGLAAGIGWPEVRRRCDSVGERPRMFTPPPDYDEHMEDGSDESFTPPKSNSAAAIPSSASTGFLSVSPKQVQVISMEEDDLGPPADFVSHLVDDHGPFNSLLKLLEKPAHLAVFLHYLISNSDPCSLLFYLVTEAYLQGSAKEMRRWAYEIHSTFLVPNCPLRVNVDESVCTEVDTVLAQSQESYDQLRRIFRTARHLAKSDVNEMLADFRNKRALGLGSIYGDHQLHDNMERSKELKIAEQTLLPHLEQLSEDYENNSGRSIAMASAILTQLRIMGAKSPIVEKLAEKVPQFCSPLKSKFRFSKASKMKALLVRGHQLQQAHFNVVTYCQVCYSILWGIGFQGWKCDNCDFNVHKGCMDSIQEECVGVHLRRDKKDKKADRRSTLVDKIIFRKSSNVNNNPTAVTPSYSVVRAKQIFEEKEREAVIPEQKTPPADDDTVRSFVPLHRQESVEKDMAVRSRVEKLREKYETSNNAMGRVTEEAPVASPVESPSSPSERSGLRVTQPSNGSTSNLQRSESLKSEKEKSKPAMRKKSDPALSRLGGDADAEHPVNISGSSSASSLSMRSLDSPSTSLEAMNKAQSTADAAAMSSVREESDSDLEAEPDPPNWKHLCDKDQVRRMKPKEVKRQDVINELFHTERTHVRNLKVLQKVFYMPMENVIPRELRMLLFPNIEEMLRYHGSLNIAMKERRRRERIVGDIGEMMLSFFDGEAGEKFKQACATFCRHQSVALDQLKHKMRSDKKVATFLMEAESNPLCRRFGLKDIIPTGMQRLTKYPLLFDNIAKYTPHPSEEYTMIRKTQERCKDILAYVNQAVKETENAARLADFQRRLDISPLHRTDSDLAKEFRNLDLVKHHLLHDGDLSWRLNARKTIDIHALLLSDLLVLMQKADDKYVLKFMSTNMVPGKEDIKLTHSPIIKLQNILTRNVATDKKAFFLVSTSTQGPQIYELVAQTSSDRKQWVQYVTEAAEANKSLSLTPSKKKPSLRGPALPPKPVLLKAESMSRPKKPETYETGKAENTEEEKEDAEAEEKEDADAEQESHESDTSALSSSLDSLQQKQGAVATVNNVENVEYYEIIDEPPLISPAEVVVANPVVEDATPILTPYAQLRQVDEVIRNALHEKEKIIAELLNIPEHEFQHIAEMAGLDEDKDARELILDSVLQANRLTSLVSKSPSSEQLKEEQPTTSVNKDLTTITTSLNANLSQLLNVIADKEKELHVLQSELKKLNQVLALHAPTESRPNSYISIASTVSELAGVNNDLHISSDDTEYVETKEVFPSHVPLRRTDDPILRTSDGTPIEAAPVVAVDGCAESSEITAPPDNSCTDDANAGENDDIPRTNIDDYSWDEEDADRKSVDADADDAKTAEEADAEMETGNVEKLVESDCVTCAEHSAELTVDEEKPVLSGDGAHFGENALGDESNLEDTTLVEDIQDVKVDDDQQTAAAPVDMCVEESAAEPFGPIEESPLIETNLKVADSEQETDSVPDAKMDRADMYKVTSGDLSENPINCSLPDVPAETLPPGGTSENTAEPAFSNIITDIALEAENVSDAVDTDNILVECEAELEQIVKGKDLLVAEDCENAEISDASRLLNALIVPGDNAQTDNRASDDVDIAETSEPTEPDEEITFKGVDQEVDDIDLVVPVHIDQSAPGEDEDYTVERIVVSPEQQQREPDNPGESSESWESEKRRSSDFCVTVQLQERESCDVSYSSEKREASSEHANSESLTCDRSEPAVCPPETDSTQHDQENVNTQQDDLTALVEVEKQEGDDVKREDIESHLEGVVKDLHEIRDDLSAVVAEQKNDAASAKHVTEAAAPGNITTGGAKESGKSTSDSTPMEQSSSGPDGGGSQSGSGAKRKNKKQKKKKRGRGGGRSAPPDQVISQSDRYEVSHL